MDAGSGPAHTQRDRAQKHWSACTVLVHDWAVSSIMNAFLNRWSYNPVSILTRTFVIYATSVVIIKLQPAHSELGLPQDPRNHILKLTKSAINIVVLRIKFTGNSHLLSIFINEIFISLLYHLPTEYVSCNLKSFTQRRFWNITGDLSTHRIFSSWNQPIQWFISFRTWITDSPYILRSRYWSFEQSYILS